jgi:hypothetical protein
MIDAARWNFDGNYDAPTLSPSILITGGHVRCHSFVIAGFIQLLADCSHKLAGTTHRLFLPAHLQKTPT